MAWGYQKVLLLLSSAALLVFTQHLAEKIAIVKADSHILKERKEGHRKRVRDAGQALAKLGATSS